MVITFNFLFRIATLLLFFLWWFYWAITERVADQEKPKTKEGGTVLRRQQVQSLALRVAEGIMILQVLGLQLLPFFSVSIQIIGFIFVLIGTSLAITARKTLGSNWAHAYEYQVKKEQELVTVGIYSKIRHPIYTGLCLAFIGGEFVAQSYLAIIGIFLLLGGYWQARQEESILLKHFGKAYQIYMKRSKMFIPYLW